MPQSRTVAPFRGYFAVQLYSSSFAGEAGLASCRTDYLRLLDAIEAASPGARLVLLSPLPHENLVAPWPDPSAHNVHLAA